MSDAARAIENLLDAARAIENLLDAGAVRIDLEGDRGRRLLIDLG